MISDDDRSFRFGDGLFETVRVETAGPVGLDRHVARFRHSAAWLGFPERSADAGVRALESLVERDAGLWRVTVSRDDNRAPFGGSGTVVITHRPLPALVRRPRLTLAPNAYLPDDRWAEHKTTSWIRNVEVRRRAIVDGYDDAVMVSARGMVGEASAANVFVVVDGAVVTPPIRGILPGVTRARVLSAIDGIVEREVTQDELVAATEVILTSAGLGIVAAASLNGRELGDDVARSLIAVVEPR